MVSRHVIRAAKNPINLDELQVDAVAVRIELDLRIGYAFTRFQTTTLRALGGPLGELTISYGEITSHPMIGNIQF
jgi:DNA topoisomerase-3